jgi:hypothetical protein
VVMLYETLNRPASYIACTCLSVVVDEIKLNERGC